MNFTATNSPVPNVMIGQTIHMQSMIAANTTADQGTFHIFFMVQYQNAAGAWVELADIQSADKALTTTPQACTASYQFPSTAPVGPYRYEVSVRNSTWAWQAMTQTPQPFSVAAIPVVNGRKMYVPTTPAPSSVVQLIQQADGSYLPPMTCTLIPNMSIVDSSVLTTWFNQYWLAYGVNQTYLKDELERYNKSAVSYVNGQLILTATPQSGTVGHAPSPSGNVYPLWTSGMVRSPGSAKYFYTETDIILPDFEGMNMAIWMDPNDGMVDPNPECDMMEFVVNGAGDTSNKVHSNCSVTNTLLWHDDAYTPPGNGQNGFISIDPSLYGTGYWLNRRVKQGTLWMPDDTITVYYDGVPFVKWHFPWMFKGSPAKPACLLIDFAIGGAWATANWQTPVKSNAPPAQAVINYVRTFALSQVVQTTTPITVIGGATPA